METKETIWFVYDGECPICQMGASLYQVKQSVGVLHTVDARTEREHPVMMEVNQAGLNLDQGMVVKYQGQLYQGKGALLIMAQLGADDGFYNKVNNILFRSPTLSAFAYPIIRSARNMLLTVLGRDKLNNLERAVERKEHIV